MNFLTNLSNTISERATVAKVNIQAHSPEILIGVGIASMVTSTVLACRATLKAKDVVEKRKSDLAELREVKAAPENADGALYSEEAFKKDVRSINIHTGLKVAGLYLPAVTAGILGVSCFVKSNDIHRQHEASLAAAYAGVDQLFKKYRERVKEELGEEADDKFRYGIRKETVEKEVVDEKGEKKTEPEEIEVIDQIDPADFAFIFDHTSRYWDTDSAYRSAMIISVQDKLNAQLYNRAKFNHDRGFIRLSEVADEFAIPRSKETEERWSKYGWVLDLHDPLLSETKIDLNPKTMFVRHGDKAHERVGKDRIVLIRPNVQGNIFELMR